jgi:hypothetical protein
MKQHPCPRCGNLFVCDKPADECFCSEQVCHDCFLKHDVFYFLGVIVLAVIAGAMSIFLYKMFQG